MINPNPYPLGRWTSTSAVKTGILPAVKSSAPICEPERQLEATSKFAHETKHPLTPALSPIGREGASRKVKRSVRPPLPAGLLEGPLRELFWSEPDAERLTEAQQRITNFLNAALTREPIQLFDDLYELPAC
jgi:hypothetical protein